MKYLILFFLTTTAIFISVTLNCDTKRSPASEIPLSPSLTSLLTRADQDFKLPAFNSVTTISFDFNDDVYPDFIFIDSLSSTRSTARAFLNIKGNEFQELSIIGLELYPYADMKIVRGLFDKETATAVVRYFQAGTEGKTPMREMEYFSVSLKGNTLLFKKMMNLLFLPAVIDNLGDFSVADFNHDGVNDIVTVSHYPNWKSDVKPPNLFLSQKFPYKELTKLYPSKSDHLRSRESDAFQPAFAQIPSTFYHLAKNFKESVLAQQTKKSPYFVPSYNVSICDVNNDGNPDILVAAYGRAWNKLFLGSHRNGFEEVGKAWNYAADRVGINDPRGGGNSFTTACADINNTGYLDLFQAELTHKWAGPTSDISSILWNDKGEKFIRSTPLPRKSIRSDRGDTGAMWGDLDNDGFQDLLVDNSDYPPETHLELFKNLGNNSFASMTKSWLSEIFYNPKAALLVDIDLDGSLDIVSSASGMRWDKNDPTPEKLKLPHARIFKNSASTLFPLNKWIQIRLRGNNERVAVAPYGARVYVQTSKGRMMREFTLGYGSGIQYPETMHFGLGDIPEDEVSVTVVWPSLTSRKTYLLKTNRVYPIIY